MKKKESSLKARREFVKKTVSDRKGERTSNVVKDLAKKLFLSETTIYNDLKS